MPFWSWGKESVMVAADVSRSSVKIVAFRFNSRDKELAYINHHAVMLPATAGKLGNFMRALAALQIFIEETMRHREVVIDEVALSVPGAFLVSEVREFRFVRPDAAVAVTERELGEIWRKIRGQSAALLLPQGVPENAYEAFTPEPERVTLDGYSLAGTARATGREITIAALVSAWPEEFAEAAAKLKALFPKVRFALIPEAALLCECVTLCRGPAVSGVAIDIGAADSTMLLLDHGSLGDLWTFPFGGRDATSAVAKEFSLKFDDAEIIKRQWIKGALDTPSAGRILPAVTAVIDLWKREWGDLLAARAETRVVVPHFFLLGRGALLPPLADELCDQDWLEKFSAGTACEASVLPPGTEKAEIFSGWPLGDLGQTVLFPLVSRMIH